MSYCSFCGKELANGAKCTCPGAAGDKKQAPQPKKDIKKIAMPAVILLAVVIAVICIVSYMGAGIDLEDYITINGVSGLNGQGTISYSLDESALYAALTGDSKSDEITEKNFEEALAQSLEKYEEAGNAVSCITVSASPETGLSNEDEVTITATFKNTKGYKLRHHFKDGSVKYTVSGLKDGLTLDPFADDVISVSFSGFTGSGEADLEVIAQDDIYKSLRYELSDYEELSNGDTVSVAVSYDVSVLEEMGYFAPETTEKTYTVEGLQEYFSLSGEFPLALLNEMCDQFVTVLQEDANTVIGLGGSIVNEPKAVSAYYLESETPGETVENFYDLNINNAVFVAGYYTQELLHTQRDNWCICAFPNCSLDANGDIIYDVDGVQDIWFMSFSEDEFVSWLEEEFPGMTMIQLPIS